MRISALLESKGSAVATVAPDATVRDAVGLLDAHGIGALVVSTDGSHIVGIISERDIVRELDRRSDGDLLGLPVSTIMSSTVHTCTPVDTTASLMATMTNMRIRHVPVVDGDLLAGIVSIGDVVKSVINELERERKELVDYIHAR
jgi:CBS domain-containing protein